MMKVKAVTEQQISQYLGRCPRKPLQVNAAKPKTTEQCADRFLRQFTASSIYSTLEEEEISLRWVIQQLVDLYNSDDAKVSEKVMILDRIREFVHLGAIQDKGFLRSLDNASTTKKLSDPFIKKVS